MAEPRLVCVPNSGVAGRRRERRTSRHTARFMLDLARAWPGAEFVHARVAAGDADELADYDVSRHPELVIRTIPWHTHSRLTRWLSNVLAAPWVAFHVWRSRALYVFLPGNLPLVAVLVARLLGRPYGAYLRGEMAPRWQRATLARASFVLASNEGMKQVAARHCPDVELIRPMLEIEASDVVDARPQHREGPWRILFVGRIEPAKGAPELLEAVEILHRQGTPLRLDLVGGGPGGDWFEGFRRRIAASDAADRVHLHGVVSDREALADFYRQADLFVLPTHSDGFARVLFEAMAYGAPILTCFVGGIGAVMRDGVDCVRIEPRDAAGLARRMAEVLADPELRARVAAGGARTVRAVLAEQVEPHGTRAAGKLRVLVSAR